MKKLESGIKTFKAVVSNTLVMKYLTEAYNRFGQKSPAFFRVINKITATCVAIAGIPTALENLNVKLPPQIEQFANITFLVSAAIAWFIGKMTVAHDAIAVTDAGKESVIVSTTPTVKMPFTTAKAQQDVDKKEFLENL